MRGELVHICECEVCCWLYCKHSQMLVWISWLVNGNSYFVFFFFCLFYAGIPLIWDQHRKLEGTDKKKKRVENWKLATFSIITPQNETLKRMKNFVHIFRQTDEVRASILTPWMDVTTSRRCTGGSLIIVTSSIQVTIRAIFVPLISHQIRNLI